VTTGQTAGARDETAHRDVRFDFTGSWVLVTGASRGIGLGVAEGFADAGADLVLLADDPELPAVAERMRNRASGRIDGRVCDVRDRDGLAEVAAGLDRLDVLVSNAGIELRTPLGDPDAGVDERFAHVTDVNVQGTWNVLRAFSPVLAGGGRVVMTSSIWGRTGQADFAAYSASKHAIIGLTRTLAREFGPRGISVNAVCPGWVRTDAAIRSLEAIAGDEGESRDAMLERILAAQALPGLMGPPDMAETFLFLASAAARNITGQAITVDRGETCV